MTEYPPILTGTAQQQIAALRDYLVRRARAQDESAPGTGEQTAAPGSGPLRLDSPGTASPAAAPVPEDAALRALIVKTADSVRHQVELLSESLHEDYLARSDFGEYQEQMDLAIRATARQIVESYDYDARLRASDESLGLLRQSVTSLHGQIRRGLIRDPETGEIAFGIAVAEELRFTGSTVTAEGQSYGELAPGQTLGLYTASGWQFWCNGSKRGWFDASDGQLHVRSLAAEQEQRLGTDWLLTAAGGFGIRYTGA